MTLPMLYSSLMRGDTCRSLCVAESLHCTASQFAEPPAQRKQRKQTDRQTDKQTDSRNAGAQLCLPGTKAEVRRAERLSANFHGFPARLLPIKHPPAAENHSPRPHQHSRSSGSARGSSRRGRRCCEEFTLLFVFPPLTLPQATPTYHLIGWLYRRLRSLARAVCLLR
ncbi:hypothetical protein AOLI_G00137630 [Acnodon oligacanthus]